MLSVCPGQSYGQESDQQSAEDWFTADHEERAAAISEGALRFIAPQPKKYILHSNNTLQIQPQSLNHGWVRLEQCYYNLDPMESSSINYEYRGMKNLEVMSSSHIGKVDIAGQSIELRQIQKQANLCIRAQVQLLESRNGEYRLRSGPYHRKFLDGYYPFHVSLKIEYPEDKLKTKRITPEAQQGFSVTDDHKQITIDSWFEGKLVIEILFSAIQ